MPATKLTAYVSKTRAWLASAAGKVAECSDNYMTVKLHKNGNTHFTLADSTRDALNRYGPTGATIGENIKIKVFPDRWAS